jgi:hypothetical protein
MVDGHHAAQTALVGVHDGGVDRDVDRRRFAASATRHQQRNRERDRDSTSEGANRCE